MKALLSVMILISSLGARAENLQDLNSTDLYQQIRKMYEESRMAYPFEEETTVDIDKPTFKGCVVVTDQGQKIKSDEAFIFGLKFTSVDYGPLEPKESKNIFLLGKRKLFKEYFDTYDIENGVFDLGNQEYLILACAPVNFHDAKTDFYAASYSGYNVEKQSYEVAMREVCGTKIGYRGLFRKSGNFLVGKIQDSEGISYQYCW